jgi:glutaredoxin 2
LLLEVNEMNTKQTRYLCMVIDRYSGKDLAEFEVDASNEYFAKHKARSLFEERQKYQPRLRKHEDWYVDSCECY